jgi:hypothetical protein
LIIGLITLTIERITTWARKIKKFHCWGAEIDFDKDEKKVHSSKK